MVTIAPKIKVKSDNGKISINNIVFESGGNEKDRIKAIAMKIAGVEEVVLNVKIPVAQKGHINPFYIIG